MAETLSEPAVIAGQVIALLTVGTLVIRLIVSPMVGYIDRTMRRVHVLGEIIERELAPNGGESIKDRVADLQGKLMMVSREVWEIEQQQKFMAAEIEQLMMKSIETGKKQDHTIGAVDSLANIVIEDGKERKNDG